jgi:hypothetical protein
MGEQLSAIGQHPRLPRTQRPRVRPTAGQTVTLDPAAAEVLCQVMAWAGGYLMMDDPAAGADLYLRQVELELDPELPTTRALELGLTLRDGAQSMPTSTRRGKALRRLLQSAADTISHQARTEDPPALTDRGTDGTGGR